MSQLGVVFDTLSSSASQLSDVFDALSTGMDICDGVVIALDAASAIPGAAAVCQPVANTYRIFKPPLEAVINLLEMISDYLLKIIDLIQTLENVCSGKFNALAGLPLTPLNSPIDF